MSPFVDLTSKTPSPISKIDTSKVPPPRSYTAILTSSPFFESGEVEPHRHFALSDGTYKGLLELQYFKKTAYNPVFWGLKTEVAIPLSDSDYGYRAGESYNIALTTLFKLNSKTPVSPIGISLGLFYLHMGQGYWNDTIDPSSKSTMIVPSIGGIWKIGKQGFSINVQKPYLIDGIGVGNADYWKYFVLWAAFILLSTIIVNILMME